MIIIDTKNHRLFEYKRKSKYIATFQYETPNMIRISYKTKSGIIKRVMINKTELRTE